MHYSKFTGISETSGKSLIRGLFYKVGFVVKNRIRKILRNI